jgi:hypothetical protein
LWDVRGNLIASDGSVRGVVGHFAFIAATPVSEDYGYYGLLTLRSGDPRSAESEIGSVRLRCGIPVDNGVRCIAVGGAGPLLQFNFWISSRLTRGLPAEMTLAEPHSKSMDARWNGREEFRGKLDLLVP